MSRNYKCFFLYIIATVLVASLSGCDFTQSAQDETRAFFDQAGDKVWTHHYYDTVNDSYGSQDIYYDTVVTFRQDAQFFGELYAPDSGEIYRFQGDYSVTDDVLTLAYQWDSSPGVTFSGSYHTSFTGSAMSMDLIEGDGIIPDDDTYPVSYIAHNDLFTSNELKEHVLSEWGIAPQ